VIASRLSCSASASAAAAFASSYNALTISSRSAVSSAAVVSAIATPNIAHVVTLPLSTSAASGPHACVCCPLQGTLRVRTGGSARGEADPDCGHLALVDLIAHRLRIELQGDGDLIHREELIWQRFARTEGKSAYSSLAS
jgi:hypothetical protein